jgi:hypothetical protein
MNEEQKKVWEILNAPPPTELSKWLDDFDVTTYVGMIKAGLLSTNEARKVFYEQYMTHPNGN